MGAAHTCSLHAMHWSCRLTHSRTPSTKRTHICKAVSPTLTSHVNVRKRPLVRPTHNYCGPQRTQPATWLSCIPCTITCNVCRKHQSTRCSATGCSWPTCPPPAWQWTWCCWRRSGALTVKQYTSWRCGSTQQSSSTVQSSHWCLGQHAVLQGPCVESSSCVPPVVTSALCFVLPDCSFACSCAQIVCCL